jgi:hypothetical protein
MGGRAFVFGTRYWLLTAEANNVNVLLAIIFHFFCEDEGTMPSSEAEVKQRAL